MSRRRVIASGLMICLVVTASGSLSPAVSREPAISGDNAASGGSTPVGTWRTWLLEDQSRFRLPAPPTAASKKTKKEMKELLVLQGKRTRAVKRSVARWNRGPATAQWTEVALDMIEDFRPRPPFAARALGLLHTGMYDAMVGAYDSREAYPKARPHPAAADKRIKPLLKVKGSSYAEPRAAIAGAAEEILAYLFPNKRPAYFRELASEAVGSRLWAGASYRSDVERARKLGRRVGALAVQYGQTDGSDSTGFSGERLEGEAYWVPTPPGYEDPIGGPVGKWKPWLMAEPSSLRNTIPGPFAYGSPEFMAETQEVLDVQANLTKEQRQIAHFWDDPPGTVTPPGHWFDIMLDQFEIYGTGTKEAARASALLGTVALDSAIAVFEAKYEWWSIRPITTVWRLCDGELKLCTEAEIRENPSRADYRPGWTTPIITPAFPAYPSGHATFSGGGGEILSYLFPGSAGQLNEMAEEAAMSRLYGGIHFRSDDDDGLILGRNVARLAIEWAENDGSGK